MKLTTSIRKRFRVSNKVKKVASKDRFRLCISRTSRNISAQIIDDIKNITLMSASSIEKGIASTCSLLSSSSFVSSTISSVIFFNNFSCPKEVIF